MKWLALAAVLASSDAGTMRFTTGVTFSATDDAHGYYITGNSYNAAPNKVVAVYGFPYRSAEIFSIAPDGKVTLGPAFTTKDEASRVFLQSLGYCLQKDGGK